MTDLKIAEKNMAKSIKQLYMVQENTEVVVGIVVELKS